MVPHLVSHETAEMMNVSQNAETPDNSSPGATAPVVPDTYQERIEDSYKDANMPTMIQAVETVAAADEDDELYSLSPKGKAALEIAKASARKSTTQAEAHNLHGETRREVADITAATTKPAEHISAKAARGIVDGLLSQGATARPSQVKTHRSKTKSNEQPDEAASNRREVADTMPTGTTSARPATKPAPLASHTTQRPNQQANITTAAGRSAASASTSAVAALRAKRQGPSHAEPSKAASVTPAPVKRSKAAQTPAVIRPPLKERNKNLQTPARTDPKAQPTDQQPTTGKLKSRRLGMLAETPASRPAASQEPKRKREADHGVVGEESDVDDDRQSFATASEMRPSAPGTLKRPGRALKASLSARRRPTYDVPVSSVKVDPARPAKRGRVAAKSAAKPQGPSTGTTSKPANRSQDPAPSRSVPKRDSKVKQKAVEDEHDEDASTRTRKQPSRCAKLPVDTHDKQSQTELEASIDRMSPEGSAGKKDLGPLEDGRNANETIEDFEHAVMDFAGDETAIKAIEHESTVKPTRIKAEPAAMAREEPPVSAKPTDHVQRGASQNQAIVLSDRAESSSPIRSSSMHPNTAPPALTTNARRKQQAVKAPQTPAVLRSSPPVGLGASTLPLTAALLDANASRKSTIISFDRSGPRNQGSTSVKKSAPGSAWTNRTSPPPRRVPLASEAGSSHARLDTRRRNGPPSAAASMRSTRTIRTAPPSNVAEDVGDALAGFFKKPLGHTIPTPANVVRTQQVNRLSSPEPLERQRDLKADDDGFANVDDYEGTTFVNTEPTRTSPPAVKRSAAPSASQQAMPPPAPKAHKMSMDQPAPTVPSMLSPQGNRAVSPADHNAADKPRSKRAVSVAEHEAAPAPKRLKTAAVAHPPLALPSAVIAAPIVKANPSVFQAAKKPVHPSKRGSRKPSRHGSQGNVDMHGSPIPKGLVVLDNATALESFSQQAGLSSDQVLAVAAAIVDRRGTREQPNDSSAFDEHVLPPSHQPEILSSNTKLRPASPEDESQAITGIVLGRVDPRQLIIRDVAAPPATDPFTSSEDARKEPPKGSMSSIFAEQLRQHAAQAATLPRQSGSDDPDKTLVEPEVARETKPKRVASVSSDDSSETSSSSNETSTTMRDIGMWRSALQPYQTNLFDELVNVSHRLVRHLVDRETATREVVDDYRRRGLNLVEQMERAHAQQYQQYLLDLKQRKRRLRKELTKCSEQVQDAVDAVREAKKKRTEEAGKRDDEERKLQELMAQFC
ncbi:hypothetical protein LTR36_007100 [Oleoguttula mirabilis]|uniref:Uncharacterized protein n=1 Tax=Oleoguttula mirabilis TaxID=1507867 RepID=A0AAV9JAM3_9PEZI|nr:hypothetical protein LTR36_007100 [Oleoguttula mirabilis]